MRPDTNSSDSSRGKYQRKRSSGDRTLLGKTAVSALHEFCAKRKFPTPQFNLQPTEEEGFVMTVDVNHKERGRGRGGTKASAKQDAARQALQALLPGVVFDDNGILVELPTSSSVGDLAPTLASRLAIGEESKKRQPSTRSWDVYPGTSTTSGEEDNDYYASRGASVCSALLHALWQIDDCIPEPPSYTFEVDAATAKRKGAVGTTAIAVQRLSFACTARLLVKRPVVDKQDDKKDSTEVADTETNADSSEKADVSNDEKDQFNVETLIAVGTAATKREARHASSAKLLALLFPECNGMVEVIAAAEAFREKYAAEKALKMQSRRIFAHEKRKFTEPGKIPRKRSIDFATPNESDPPLPSSMNRHLRSLLANRDYKADESSVDDDVVSVESLSLSEKALPRDEGKKVQAVSHVEESLTRSLSRKKQLDERVDHALQVMNELDEEGRHLPEELDSNDVGRTVLRRAESEDADWIRKLLANQDDCSVSSRRYRTRGRNAGPFALLGVSMPSRSSSLSEHDSDDGSESLSLPSRLWGSTTITLLLCRVISPKDDPPLGCAVLTLGFSMNKGPVLRIAELVSEPHLPKERFIECLEKFASHMSCVLDTEVAASDVSNLEDSSETVYSTEQLKSIVEAHLCRPRRAEGVSTEENEKKGAKKSQSGILDLKTISTSLQSVQEEEAEGDDDKGEDDTDADLATKADKPSKRSRVV